MFILSQSGTILYEDIEETMNDFHHYIERKMRGYSVGQVDTLASRAKKVNSEVAKREVLDDIDDALKDAREVLADSTDDKKKRNLRMQITVLNELKSKVKSFKVVDNHEKEKDDVERRKVNLDE